MNTSGSSFWSSGSVPLIDAEVLSSIITVASDIALVVSHNGKILSVLINPNETSFGKLSHWEGRPLMDFATGMALLAFFVFALQCMSTLAVIRRETDSWRWPAFAFCYLLALAYGASFATHRLVGWWVST